MDLETFVHFMASGQFSYYAQMMTTMAATTDPEMVTKRVKTNANGKANNKTKVKRYLQKARAKKALKTNGECLKNKTKNSKQ